MALRSVSDFRRNRLHHRTPERMDERQARRMDISLSNQQELFPFRAQGPRTSHGPLELSLIVVSQPHYFCGGRRKCHYRQAQSKDSTRESIFEFSPCRSLRKGRSRRCRRKRGRTRRHAARAPLRPYFLYGKPQSRSAYCRTRSQNPCKRYAGTRRQIPNSNPKRSKPGRYRKENCMGKNAECRPNLHRSRLYTLSKEFSTTAIYSYRPKHQGNVWADRRNPKNM